MNQINYSLSLLRIRFLISLFNLSVIFSGCATSVSLTTQTMSVSTVRTFANPTPDWLDHFGHSVAIDGDYILIGAIWDDAGATNSGAAYLYNISTGSMRQFLNPVVQDEAAFGYAVAIKGSRIAISAILAKNGDLRSGAVYLFDTTTGNLLRTYNNPTPEQYEWFGSAVAISGNRLIIGSSFDNTGGIESGAAYLYDTETGALLRTFSNPSPNRQDRFGFSADIEGDYVLIGAPHEDARGQDAGIAYLFNASTGSLSRTFNNPDPKAGDRFGEKVALNNGRALIAAPFADIVVKDCGAVYLFDVTTGNLIQAFLNPHPDSYKIPWYMPNWFGSSIDIDGEYVVIGAAYDNAPVVGSGTAYLANIRTGELVQLLNPDSLGHNRFGESIALSGNRVLVGAPRVGTPFTGAAYLFQLSLPPGP